jgi:hypothetical protein
MVKCYQIETEQEKMTRLREEADDRGRNLEYKLKRARDHLIADLQECNENFIAEFEASGASYHTKLAIGRAYLSKARNEDYRG